VKPTPLGSLTILLNFDPYQVQGAKLKIPLLAIDEHIPQFAQFDDIPAGVYTGTITAFLTNGEEAVHPVKIKIVQNQGNLHEFKLSGRPQEVVIRPVDAENNTILFSELKIENVDLNFRPVRDEKGLICRVRPGDYQVQVILPNLSIKTLPIKITSDHQIYTLTIPDRHAQSRKEPRIELNVPVDYQTTSGDWVPTKSVNISTRGVCIVKRKWSMDDEELQLRIYLPVIAAPLECAARVRWVKEDGSSSVMGLEMFLTQNLKSELSKWLVQTGKKPLK
jgi:PilZ domain-containing protein